ncbi:hypothetical protein ScPMuIL_012295 [Solemya velum]
MLSRAISCFGHSCNDVKPKFYETTEQKKNAQMRDKQLNKLLNELHKEDLKRLKLLLLGTGESGKSTLTKQMKIIHINGFDTRERMSKIADIKMNIKESIVVISSALHNMGIPLEKMENKSSFDFILSAASDADVQHTTAFLEHTERLWADAGIQLCYQRSHEYQLLDSAKYFLDRLDEIKQPDYIPTNQDILRCRVITTSIQHIEFDVPDCGKSVRFGVYDVGGQRGERKKWIQVFDGVVAILFVADCSAFDQTLREDPTKNRLLESLEIFEQVWKNRFLRNVSVLMFLNKVDILAEKVLKGRDISRLHDEYPDVFPDFDSFTVSNSERHAFEKHFSDPVRKRHRNSSKPDTNPDVVKAAVYIKHLFLKIVNGEMSLRHSVQKYQKDWHQHHKCYFYYTCAVNTKNVQNVLDGCRSLIIQSHLERFGVI